MKLNGKRRTSNELSTCFTFLSYAFDTEQFHPAQKPESLSRSTYGVMPFVSNEKGKETFKLQKIHFTMKKMRLVVAILNPKKVIFVWNQIE
ncbi:hypothetical protein [Leptospira santarosai]